MNKTSNAYQHCLREGHVILKRAMFKRSIGKEYHSSVNFDAD